MKKRRENNKMKRKLMSLLLVVLMIITTMTTATINANASMLPLKEVKAYLVLNGYSDEQIKAIPIKDVLSKMQDKDGNYITVPESAEVVWAHFKDNDGNTIGENNINIKIADIYNTVSALKPNYEWATDTDKYYKLTNLSDSIVPTRNEIKITKITFEK